MQMLKHRVQIIKDKSEWIIVQKYKIKKGGRKEKGRNSSPFFPPKTCGTADWNVKGKQVLEVVFQLHKLVSVPFPGSTSATHISSLQRLLEDFISQEWGRWHFVFRVHGFRCWLEFTGGTLNGFGWATRPSANAGPKHNALKRDSEILAWVEVVVWFTLVTWVFLVVLRLVS